MTPNSQDFQRRLDELLETAKNDGLAYIDVTSGELHKMVGGYPSRDARMPTCCRVMRKRMRGSDKEFPNDLKNYGATVEIRYHLSS